MSRWNSGFVIIALAAWILIFLAGVNSYNGSKGMYCVFSLIFLMVISSAFLGVVSYSYIFTCCFLFVGLWFKMSLHAWEEQSYAEPVGYFDGSGHAWDTVLLVCSIGGVGVIGARILYQRFDFMLARRVRPEVSGMPNVPEGYRVWRLRFWMGLGGIVILSLAANEMFGLLKLGHTPQWYLPWPLHGIYGWLMSVGLSLVIGTLMWWDVCAGFGVQVGALCLFFESVLVSVSAFSRGLYFLQTLPFLVLVLANGPRLIGHGWKRLAGFAAVWLLGLLITIASANYFRHYTAESIQPHWLSQGKPLTTQGIESIAEAGEHLLTRWARHLAVDRWPGLEGVMAVSSYPEKGLRLLLQVATVRRHVNKADFYTAEVARSGLTDEDAKKFHYASVAGPIAFLFYSGSLWCVCIGMCILTFVVMACERGLAGLTGNSVMCAVFGAYAAFLLVQISGGLSQPAASLLFTIMVVLALHYWRVIAYARQCIAAWSNPSPRA
ncbi:MAG: conserved membrane protein of unknown function [Nitrospira sp.]|nr:MAG: conserved membrane protein of unknown function [Nitrospira sp.]